MSTDFAALDDAAKVAEIRRVLAFSRTPAGEGLIAPRTQRFLDFLLLRTADVRAEERRAIVAWLRERVAQVRRHPVRERSLAVQAVAHELDTLADAIEHGEHTEPAK